MKQPMTSYYLWVTVTYISWLSDLAYTSNTFKCKHIILGLIGLYETTDDLILFVGHCDLYFMVEWFWLINPTLFDVFTPCFG